MANILYEAASFQDRQHISGVGYYAKTLFAELAQHHTLRLSSGPFNANGSLNKVYRKMASYGIALPYDVGSKTYDLALFPNFASFPTVKAKKRAVVIHDLTYLYHPEDVESKNLSYLQRVVPRSIASCDYVITVSETVKQEITREFSIDPSIIIVTPIPPRNELLQSSQKIEIHKKYSIPTKEYLLFVGNLEPRKNVDTLVDAYLALPTEFQQKYSLIIGGGRGWNSSDTSRRIAKLQDETNLRHIGYIDDEDMASLYAQANIFLSASHYEGFGMPILESIACNTPVITSDIPVFNEILGKNGVYIRSAEEMATKIMKICNSNDELQQAISRQKNTLKKYSWERNVHAIEQLL